VTAAAPPLPAARRAPLRAVLDALGSGAPTLAAVSHRTGLDATFVSAAVDQLVRTGHVVATEVPLGCSACPASGGCPVTGGPDRCGQRDGRTVLALRVPA
jgi:hypothetical protein